jgi:Formate hydrogenlyase subunit 6/NADH:ubiquinone oxidoreductase 23 kD subunit (chain I)
METLQGLRGHLQADLQEADHAAVPGVQAAGLSALPRRHRLSGHENGLEKCVGCSLCAAAARDCIRVVAAENTPDNRVSAGERYARIYEINLSRCIFCGYCELACPFDAITLGNEYEISEHNRDDQIYTKDMLLAPPVKQTPVADPDLYDTPIPFYKSDS